MLLLIDNYDSFTWNLVHGMGAIEPDLPMEVRRNDQIDVDEARGMNPTHLVISPGPCTPEETGVCRDLIRYFTGRIPILGVCLGHQSIADVHGMEVVQHEHPMHGKTSMIHHDGRGLFQDLPNPFQATRYPLCRSRESLSRTWRSVPGGGGRHHGASLARGASGTGRLWWVCSSIPAFSPPEDPRCWVTSCDSAVA